MSQTTILESHDTENMIIQHLTYDESHDELPNLNKRLSASTKVRSFISRRISRSFDTLHLTSHDEEKTEDRPAKLFPHVEGSKTSLAGNEEQNGKTSDMTGYPAEKHRAEKEERKVEKVLQSANSSGSYLPLTSPTGSSSMKGKGEGLWFNSLKKAGVFSDLKGKISRRPGAEAPQKGREEEKEKEKGNKMVKIYNLRQAMQEGKLERVVPPPTGTISSGSNRRPPPRPSHNPFVDQVSSATSVSASSQHQVITPQILSPKKSLQSERPTSRSRKTKPASSRIKGLLGESADILDERRREIQEKLRPPFEHLKYPSFSLGRREGGDGKGGEEGDSDDSFFCLGDAEPGVLSGGGGDASAGGLTVSTPMRNERLRKDERHRPKTRGKGSERVGSHDRGQGPHILEEGIFKRCKLCGSGIVAIASTRGLCRECEAEFLPLKLKAPTAGVKSVYSDSEYEDDIVLGSDTDEDEIPPVLPLEIRKQTPPEEAQHTINKARNPFAFLDSDSDGGDERPPVPPKDEDIILGLSLPRKTYKPSITPPSITRQTSQRAKVEIDTEMESEVQCPMDQFNNSGWRSDEEGLSPTYEEARKFLERWSDCFGDGAVEGMRERDRGLEEEDGVPLVRALDCNGVKRDSHFYKFWDEVLKEHAPRTPKAAEHGEWRRRR